MIFWSSTFRLPVKICTLQGPFGRKWLVSCSVHNSAATEVYFKWWMKPCQKMVRVSANTKLEGRVNIGGAVQATVHYFGQGHVVRTRPKIDWKFQLFLTDFLGYEGNFVSDIFECHGELALQRHWVAARMVGEEGLFGPKHRLERVCTLVQLVRGRGQNVGVSPVM